MERIRLVPDRGFPAVSPPGALMRRRPIVAEMSNFMDASLGLASGTDASSGASSPSSPSLSGSAGASVASWVDSWADGAGHFPRHSGRATPRSGGGAPRVAWKVARSVRHTSPLFPRCVGPSHFLIYTMPPFCSSPSLPPIGFAGKCHRLTAQRAAGLLPALD